MRTVLFFLAPLLLVVSGCGPQLSHTKDYDIAVGEIVAIPIDPIRREQKIKVSAQSSGNPIDVHVYLKEHEAEIERKITLGKPPEQLLANENDSEKISLLAVIPANKEVIVRLQPSGPTSAKVQVKITN